MAQRWAIALFCCALVACGKGGGDSTTTPSAALTPESRPLPASAPSQPAAPPAATTTTTPPPAAPSSSVTISGQVTYERVPFAEGAWAGLDYSASYSTPVRGATVQLSDANGAVIAEGEIDPQGSFRLMAPANTAVKVKILAELKSRQTGGYHISVRDNTRANALYVLEGALADSGAGPTQNRQLHAASGFVDGSYRAPRSAAPFAVLDSLFDALDLVRKADANAVLPPLQVYWSERNAPVSGALHEGDIGTSFYTSHGPSIYLLGAEHSDTDEYDRGVIQHEFAHYIESNLSRSESLGGSHNIYSLLDMRVAFGEALGNAFAGLAGADPRYRDAMGAGQAQGFVIDVERRPGARHGWFSEASVQTILYDLADAEQDSGDRLALGFSALYQALTAPSYLEFEGFASIFSLAATLAQQHPAEAATLTAVLSEFGIYGQDGWAEGERNDGGFSHTLPLFPHWQPGGGGVLCSEASKQGWNGLGGRGFARLQIHQAGRYQIQATRANGPLGGDPELVLSRRGQVVMSGQSNDRERETISALLSPGSYVLELYDHTLLESGQSGQLACYTVSVNSK